MPDDRYRHTPAETLLDALRRQDEAERPLNPVMVFELIDRLTLRDIEQRAALQKIRAAADVVSSATETVPPDALDALELRAQRTVAGLTVARLTSETALLRAENAHQKDTIMSLDDQLGQLEREREAWREGVEEWLRRQEQRIVDLEHPPTETPDTAQP